MTAKAVIDISIIASEWERLNEAVKLRDSIIQEKEKTIQAISKVATDRLLRINELTDIIVEKSKVIDDISNKQKKIASGLSSRLGLSTELSTIPTRRTDFQVSIVGTYDIKKIYLFASGTVGNKDYSEVRVGVGYKFF
jgi:hypothetical protein